MLSIIMSRVSCRRRDAKTQAKIPKSEMLTLVPAGGMTFCRGDEEVLCVNVEVLCVDEDGVCVSTRIGSVYR